MSMPAQSPGSSKQDYETPQEFLDACAKRFGALTIDLACRTDNAKAPRGYYFDQGCNSLVQPWARDIAEGVGWLNPEFGDIDAWAKKASGESEILTRGRILMLTPASIGTNWFADHVHRKAYVLGLSPRMIFRGMKPNPKTGKVDPYPKDLMLSVFGGDVTGFGVWRWK